MSIDPTAYSDPSYFNMTLQAPMLVGVAGGSDAGKRKLCEIIKERISNHYSAKIVILSLIDFYRPLSPKERELYDQGKFNLDHPNVFDFELLEKSLQSLLACKPTSVPVWDKIHHKRSGTMVVNPADVIILEGTFVLYIKSIRDLMFMKVFIDVDSDDRLTRRVLKAKARNERNMTIKEVLTEYVEFVKPMFDDFVLPTKKYADIIIPRGVENTPALQVMVHHLEDHLKYRSKDAKKKKLTEEEDKNDISTLKKYQSAEVLKTRIGTVPLMPNRVLH
ncbi:uridine kinase family-domain-containing protein [Phycomyces nitens]|nr:uridine kinase family-domain-containing protein [Phycomyces nitens]